jgi:hypothetical protein
MFTRKTQDKQPSGNSKWLGKPNFSWGNHLQMDVLRYVDVDGLIN